MTDEEVAKLISTIELKSMYYGADEMWGKALQLIWELQAENAALRERLEKAATFALDMCSEDDCAGDGSVGLPPCDMWHAWDIDENGVNIESGCYLKEYLAELKDRGQIK